MADALSLRDACRSDAADALDGAAARLREVADSLALASAQVRIGGVASSATPYTEVVRTAISDIVQGLAAARLADVIVTAARADVAAATDPTPEAQ